MSRGGASQLSASARSSLGAALTGGADVTRVVLRHGVDGRPLVLVELAGVHPDIELYEQRIAQLVRRAGASLARHAARVGFSPGDRDARAEPVPAAALVLDRAAS